MKTLFDALTFATIAHQGQVRKYNNLPYVTHCIDVAKRVYSYTESESLAAAAVLHDVLEDCPGYTKDDITKEFGSYISDIVDGLTNKSKQTGLNRAARKQLDLDRMKSQSRVVKIIKCFDIFSNTSRILVEDPDFARIYVNEKLEFLEALESLKDTDNVLFESLENHLKYLKVQTRDREVA